MQLRRALVAGVAILALPLLGSCGFDKATDQVYTPAAGIDDRSGDVDVLSAVIVAAQPDSGTFIASLSNNKADRAFELTGVAGAGDSSDLTVDPSDLSITVPARGFVNLVDEDPISVSGDFTPGQVIELTLTFDSGDSATMDVPVVYACNYYEGLDGSASEASASPSATASLSPGQVPTTGDTGSATASPSDGSSESAGATPSGAQQPYDCTAVGED